MTVILRLTTEALRACAAEGLSQVEASIRLGCTAGGLSQAAKRSGIKFHQHSRFAQKGPDARSEAMASLYRGGTTLQQIGERYEITRERVRQIIGKYHGLKGEDGGFLTRVRLGEARRAAARDTHWLATHGCTYSQWRYLLLLGKDMQARGIGYSRTPLGAFKSQKNNAGRRSISWELTTWQWWTIWQESGRWAKRGRGQGYVMCRKGDSGPYSAGNVVIATGVENVAEYYAVTKKKALPTGVTRAKTGRGFQARRQINGVVILHRIYPTPEEAHAAYVASAPQTAAAA